MDKQEILNALPKKVAALVTIKEYGDKFVLSHKDVSQDFYNQVFSVVERFGGKCTSYFDAQYHYEIPKVPPKAKPKTSPDSEKKIKPEMSVTDTVKEKTQPEEIGVRLIGVNSLVESPFWTREFKDDESFRELVESIRDRGVAQNLLARWKNNNLEIVIGHRRWLAAQKVGLGHVPVKIRDLTDEQVLLLQFDENERRKDLADMEKARFLQNMIVKLGYTQKQLAKKIGKSRQWVTNHVRMLKLEGHPGVNVETGDFTERQARELLKAPPERREEILKEAEEKGELPSARKIEEKVKPQGRPQVSTCEACGLGTFEPKKFRGRTVCSECAVLGVNNPSGLIKLIERRNGKASSAKPNPPTHPFKDTWEFREARRRSGISRMDEAIYKRAMQDQDVRDAGYKVVHQKEYILTRTDITLEKDDDEIPLFADNEKIHLKKQDRDEIINQLLLRRQKIKQVIRIPYEGSFSEKKADQVWAKMKNEAAVIQERKRVANKKEEP